MSDNGAQLFIVDGVAAYTYTTQRPRSRLYDADFERRDDLHVFHRLFIVEKVGTQRFYLSAVVDAGRRGMRLTLPAPTATDDLVRVYTDHGELVLFGPYTTEFWGWNGRDGLPGHQRLTATEWALLQKWSVTSSLPR